VAVDPAALTDPPGAVDVLLGLGPARALAPAQLPPDVHVRPLMDADWDAVRQIYAEGIATGLATLEEQVPEQAALDDGWLPGHRWVAEVDGQVAGWASAKRVSARDAYAGVAETSLYVGEAFRRRGVGRALVHRQVSAADAAGVWTLQASIFPGNRASLELHRAAGFRVLAVRDRLGRHGDRWRDIVLLERRRPD
jgi:L-amino acid N-acyltransferase YncA